MLGRAKFIAESGLPFCVHHHLTNCVPLLLQCVYELYVSLLSSDANYVYDMYTALLPPIAKSRTGKDLLQPEPDPMPAWFAVGILTGLAAVDKDIEAKISREEKFPMELLLKGMDFECKQGEASIATDKQRILIEIGDVSKQQQLDIKVHGRVALGALWRAMKQGGARAE